MQRLFLGSDGVSALPQLFDGSVVGVPLAFVPTAAGADPDPWWVSRDRERLERLGFVLTTLELAGAEREEVAEVLRRVAGLFISGGSPYRLLHHARESGFMELAPPLVRTGKLVYAGCSAGAMLAGPDIEPAANPETRGAAPSLASTTALGLVPFSVLPHDDAAERHALNERIRAAHPDGRFVVLRDDEAVLVTGETWRLVASPGPD